METFAPGGVDATEICLGPLCTIVAQPVIAAQAPRTVAMHSCFNVKFPYVYQIWFPSFTGFQAGYARMSAWLPMP